MEIEIVYDGEAFYDTETKKPIFYRQFLKLLCPKNNRGKKINICIISNDFYKSLQMFSSLLREFKTRNNGLDNYVGKYKIITFSEISQFKNSNLAKNTHIVFHWLANS